MPAGTSDDGTQLELPTDREILITRSFAAPARIVFEAITRPEHVRRWWAPRSRGEMLVCEVDFRVGGGWRYVMRTNSGMEVGFSGKFLEIEAPLRVVQTEIFDPFPDAASVVTVTLREAAGRTTLESRILYPSREVRDQVIATGMEHGMRESYRQLTEVVDALAR
ncbi:MAG: SRPBCC family protein [Myxococcales bacterium]|nr:SRPBCC family protein [Myxococcales bacterium]